MTDQSPLIVPIIVEAFVVNDAVRTTYQNASHSFSFSRWQMDYDALSIPADATQPQLDGTFQSDGNVGTSPGAISTSAYYDGVYLKWRLPDALRRGRQNDFPYVPNRWLVIRYGGVTGTPPTRPVAAWVVQSDATNPNDQTSAANYSQWGSPYLMAPMSGLFPAQWSYIGTNVPLDGNGWSEPGGELFLTAVGAGNPMFASYQPACNSVFSFADILYGVDPATLSYCVIGWYSDLTGDPLANGDFETVMQQLNWTVAPNAPAGATATWSLYAGFTTSVGWQNESAPMQVPAGVAVSVGTTSMDALTALIASQAVAEGQSSLQPDLLAALQLDLFRLFDQPDGPAPLQNAMLASSFQRAPAGYTWQLRKDDDPTPEEREALEAINVAQTQVDASLLRLQSLQQQLYVMWWKWVNWPMNQPEFPTQSQIDEAVNPSIPGSLANAAALARLEWETSEVALAEVIGRSDLKPEHLKREVASRFFQPKDPVVLIANAGASGIVGSGPDPLVCRFPSQLVTGFDCTSNGTTYTFFAAPAASSSEIGIPVPQPLLTGITGVPWTAAQITALVNEFFFLDYDNNDAIVEANLPAGVTIAESALSTAMLTPNGTPPPGYGAPTPQQEWANNPWHPLVLQWSGLYTPIAYGTDEAPNWTFDGTEFTWSGDGLSNNQLTLSGSVVLTPAAAMNLQTQIASFIANSGLPSTDPDLQGLQALQQFVSTQDSWDLVSQALDCFQSQLLLQTPGCYIHPNAYSPSTMPPFAPLVGSAPGYPSDINASADVFQPWRSGQFQFQTLQLVDEWGQTLDLIALGTQIVPSPSLTPNPPSGATDVIALTPALLQPARLELELLSVSGDPICGWIIPNFLDQSLLLYDSDGGSVGELTTTADDSGLCWTPAPGSSLSGTLEQFQDALKRQGANGFETFFTAVTTAISQMVPPSGAFNQSLALLIGRPLALVRASLELQLDGPPVLNPTWSSTFSSDSPVPGYSFAVQLGNLPLLQDGLVGYFREGDGFRTFYIVQQSGVSTPAGFLQPIGSDNFIQLRPAVFPPELPIDPHATKAVEVVMLLDPQLPVHASCGILPVKMVRVPPGVIKKALARMDVTFRVDTILTDEMQGKLRMPFPQGSSGWSWIESVGTLEPAYEIAQQDAVARTSATPPVARRGLLHLASPFRKRH